ncbi:hypothetical protein [Carbonactinospora thermoautotrophica]|uniref:hypothetical protein n=1 Tax=Carbonactinospora thermoautotrophica TaxID=1469144 RepID=UPI00226ECFB0|nr:hypothetical protein [Carbonactinospora thermoautotrophica]
MREGVGAATRGARVPRGWTGPERRLWAAARAGTWLDLDDRFGSPEPEEAWGRRTIRAEALRTVLTAGVGPESERRVRLRGARITGPLELRGVTCATTLILQHCLLTDPVDLTGAELPEVAFLGCRVPELRLGWLTTAGSVRVYRTEVAGPLYMTEARIGRRLTLAESRAGLVTAIGVSVGGDLDARDLVAGPVELTGARVEGRVRLGGAVVGDGGCAVRLAGANCAGDLEGAGLRAAGLVDLRTATVGGRVVLDRAELAGTGRAEPREPAGRAEKEWPGPEALLAEGLSARGDFSLRDARVRGEVRLTSAQVGGSLILSRASLENPDGWALQADRSVIGSGFFARHGFHARGALVLRDARIDGPVILSGGRIEAPDGRAFNASGINTTGGFFARDAFSCTGELRLSSAQIGGPLDLATARLSCGNSGNALEATGAAVEGDIRAAGLTATGTVDLSTIRVSGHLRMTSARLRDAATPGSGSLLLAAAAVTGSVELGEIDVDGHLDLREAEIADRVRLGGARLRGAGGRSLRATGLRAGQLRMRFAEPPGGRVTLAGAAVDALADHVASWPAEAPEQPDGSGPIDLNGFTYQRLDSTLTVDQRLDWLARATPTFEPQPYEQLAACYRQLGREREARRVLREKLRRQHAAAGPLRRAWGWVQRIAVGYGYQPGRAVAWFTGLLVAGALWFARARCARPGQTGPGLCPVKADEHPTWDPLLYSLDLLIPVVDIGHDKAWDPVGWDKAVALGLMAAGWVLATTVIAAAGRALNRT